MGNKMQDAFYARLDRIKNNDEKFAVWGAGNTGKMALSYIENYDSRLCPEFIIDNNPALWGEDIISPKSFFDARMQEVNLIFICVYVADEVESQLRDCGYIGEIMTVVPNIFYGESYKNWYENNLENIDKLKGRLADDLSVQTLEAFYEVAKTGDINVWKSVNAKSLDKTIDPSILKISESERFIDIGAFIGDTVERFLEITGGKYEKIVCIEPEPENFRILCNYLKDKKNAFAFEYAADKEPGEAFFCANMSEGGRLDASGNIVIKKIKLEDLDEAQDVSLIKVSTNGNELPALIGAKKLISKNKPKLGYYCSGAQMWEIPKFIQETVPDYKCYLRHYGFGMQAMIGYGVVD